MIPTNDRNAPLRMWLNVCAAFFLIGCSPVSKMAKPLSDFSAATSDTTTVTTSALSIVQAADQEKAIMDASQLPELKEKDVPRLFRPNDLLQRQLALQALATYAATLKSLSGVDRSADIQKSFDSLKTSMESSASSITKLSGASKSPLPSGVVSGLVSLGSNLVVAYAVGEREKAIRTALEKNDRTITKICHLLAAEIRPNGVIYDQLEMAYQRQEESASDSFSAAINPAKTNAISPEQPAAGPAATSKPSDRAPHVKTFVSVLNKKEYALALLKSLASAYLKLAQAHTALMIQSESGAKSDIQLRALSTEIDNVKFFNSQIPK